MTNEEFEDWVNNVHGTLFHVMKTDLDDNGVRVDQMIVINMISKNPKVLKHKTLKELLIQFDVIEKDKSILDKPLTEIMLKMGQQLP